MSQLVQMSARVRWWVGLPGVAAWEWSWVSSYFDLKKYRRGVRL